MKLINVAVLEGNPHLRSLLGTYLQQQGYLVVMWGSLSQAKESIDQQKPKLIIMDSDLPDGSSVEFCRRLHHQGQSLILMLSARNLEKDIVAGLHAGADDYLAKPFGMQEFLARVQALARRQRTATAPLTLQCGPLSIDLVQRRVCASGEFIDLTPQEFSLLYVLAQAQGVPLKRSELLNRAWPDAIDNPRTIDTHVLSLRKKIEQDPRQPNLVQTVRNVGYRFNPELLQEVSGPTASTLVKNGHRTGNGRR
ncbi:MAG: response regulator transcription factor [Cyanobacteria bacterium P01_H01_bin.15]